MNVVISLETEFKKRFKQLAKKYHSLTNDLLELKNSLLEDPFQGVDLGGGVRKVRMSIGAKGKGKSGGARVLTLTVLIAGDADLTLLTIYDKSEIENVSDNYIEWLLEQHKKNKNI